MACDTIKIETLDADEVVSIVTQGPQGPSGAEAATLTTTGDLLYRAALANDRLPIGSEGQVLKVSSGLPAWGNESGAVTSVNGETGAVVLDAADVGAQSAQATETIALSASVTLTASRNKLWKISNNTFSNYFVELPTTGIFVGDIVEIEYTSSTGRELAIRRDGVAFGLSLPNETKATYRADTANADGWVAVTNNYSFSGSIYISAGDVLLGRQNVAGQAQFIACTSAGRALLDDADAAAQRTTLGLGTAATSASTDFAAASHTHGNITNAGLVGTTANLPLKTGTGGIVEAGAFGTGAGEFAEGNHTHADLHTRSHAITSTSDHSAGNHKVFYSDGSGNVQELALGNSGEVLTSNGATSAPSFAAASGVTAVGASTADVLSVSGSDLVADDGGTIDSADPFIKWDDTAGKLVYANPLSRPSGAMYVGLAPTTTALGTDAVNIQPARSAATQVASGTFGPVAIGVNSTAGNQGAVAIGRNSNAGGAAVSIGNDSASTGSDSTAVGVGAQATATNGVAYGRASRGNQFGSTGIGYAANPAAQLATCIGYGTTISLRGAFAAIPFNAVYWGGQTTNDTATVLNLDATATSRFTIAANTALAVDILLVARRSDVADKWLVARRFLGIRRDGSNNTSLIGSVQTLGTDQSDGSPSWTFALTADDTNEALQLEVTGAASETVQWRATAFYRVV